MPEYIYIDENDHTETLTRPMFYSTAIICTTCGLEMWRKPQPVTVTWGGLKPSDGDLDPRIQNLVDTQAERRDKFEGVHEQHERNSQI